jgi:hypothetical protein
MKKIFLVLALCAAIGGVTAYIMYNKGHKDIAAAAPDLQVGAEQLFKDFSTDEAGANAKYLDKVVEVSGVVKETIQEGGSTQISLQSGDESFGVMCELDPLSQHARKEVPAGENVKLKCMCTGINLDVQLKRCVESK